MDEAMLSSPDPLNDSATYQSPAKPRRSSRARRSLPLQGSSPKKQTFELDVGNSLSPQKIRVTVEAGESDAENAYPHFNDFATSPTRMPKNWRRERTTTTTTTIPVKGLSDSEDEAPQAPTPKRGRGRPRKSIGTPVVGKKPGRASTPTQKNRRRSIGSLVDGDDDEDINFRIGKGVEIGRGKGRSKSRSRSTKGTRNSTPAAKEPAAATKPASGTAVKKGRGRRKSLAPEEIQILEDESCQGNDAQDQEQADGHYDNDGALEPLDSNGQSYESLYSTMRSTTTVGGTEADVVIARFDPDDGTPPRVGWSSPHVIDAPSSSRQRSNSYPLPSVTPARSIVSQDEDEGVEEAHAPGSEREESARSDHDGYDDIQYHDEGGEEIEYRDFDTILEGEGFSMISVDSVPSLREHFSSPMNQPERQQSSQAKNKSLLSVREEQAAYDDSFSAIPETVLEAATPGRKPQNPRLLSVQKVRADDSFSSIPPEVLQAATPARKSQVSKLVSQNTPGNDSFSSIAPEILEAATPHRALPKKKISAANLNANHEREDTVPAGPGDSLTAAPAAELQLRPSSSRLNVSGPRLSVSPSQPTIPAPTRLLTPEETPSPPVDESEHRPSSKGNASEHPVSQASRQGSHQESSINQSHLPSSPPIAPRRYTYTAHLRQNRQLNQNMTQTPSIVFSSPALPPPIQIGRGAPLLAPPTDPAQRPALSPTVRAGRMLQDILIPSSPRSRSQSLGSPFKSPAADRRSSSILAQESYPSPVHERPTGPLPRLDLSEHFGGSSQRHSRSQQEDPFRSSNATQQRSPSPEEKQEYTLELPQQRRYSDPRRSSTRSEAGSMRSDDAMSWQAEEELPLPVNNSSSRNAVSFSNSRGPAAPELSAEDRWAAERAAVVQQVANANESKVIVIDSDDEYSKNGQEDDEDFGLLLETLNSSSPAVERREAPKEASERPRRSKLPSPWRKNSKRLVYSDELSHMPSSPPVAKVAEFKVPEAKSFAKQNTTEPVTVRRIAPQVASDDLDIDLSEYQIPQKANFNPRPRGTGNLDLSALLGTSPPKPKDAPSLESVTKLSSFQRQPRSQPSARELPKEKPVAKPEEPKTDAPSAFNAIPQKLAFNPRPRVSSSAQPAAVVPALFAGPSKPNQTIKYEEPQASSPVSTPLMTSSPSRANTLHSNRPHLSEGSPSEGSVGSRSPNIDKENQVLAKSRTLKWTESLHVDSTTNVVLQTPLPPLASPTKSCLRSPLKTPSANLGSSSTSSNLSPSKGVTWVSSSPTPEPPTHELSATAWSKDHWRLLDTIVQTWKPENNTSPLSSNDGKESSARRRRNSTRVISRLLGKTVFSGDQKMKLEQWHLEAVDEFRGWVEGWQEKVVAMRLFALLVGEERRALGLVGGGKVGSYDHLN